MVFADLFNHEMDFFEVGVFTAGAISRVGKHGDFRSFTREVFEGFGSVFDDGVELFFSREFVYASVGESEDLTVFLTDKTAREIGGF